VRVRVCVQALLAEEAARIAELEAENAALSK
jgi:hypothetical protein